MPRPMPLFMPIIMLAAAAAAPPAAAEPAQPAQPSAAQQSAASPAAQAPGAPAELPKAEPSPPKTAADLAPTVDAVNNAKLGDGPAAKDGVSPVVLRAEVMLDRLHASPGVIDGKDGGNFTHALEAYEMQHHLPATKALDDKTLAALIHDSPGPVLTTAVLTPEDVAGPFYPDLPQDYALQAKLPSLGYRSPAQKIGAKYHMGEDLLASLNPGIDLGVAGNRIVVADLDGTKKVGERVARITVDKAKGQVFGLDARDHVIVSYPATIGSRQTPSPSGTYRIGNVIRQPKYYYDPKNFVQGNNHEKLTLPPGPNNPVGTVFMALNKPSYGLHGTPDPSTIDKTASHGCVRMTNWDADELSHLVRPGVLVRFVK